MKKTLTAIIIGAFVLSIAAISCKKSTDTPNTTNNQTANFYTASLSGFGSHGGVPSGNAYVLPSNIKVIGSLTAGIPGKSPIFKVSKNIANIPTSLPKSVYTEYGFGTYVNIYMTLYNTSTSGCKVIIPEGVVMCDSIPADSTQGGIIITPDTIDVGGNDTIRACLKSFCVNLHHSVPSYLNVYRFAAITNNQSMHTVVTILRNKKTLADHVGDIQSIIWDVTDNGGLTQADIDMMNSWQ